MKHKEEKLKEIYDNLFNPINNKDYGLYWNVSNNKTKPLANAEELLKYVKRESKEGSFINRYANLESDLILEGCIFIDFDLIAKLYLKAEKSLTLKALEDLVEESIIIEETENYNSKNTKTNLISVQKKYKKDFSSDNDFIKGFNSFIDSLTEAESKALKKVVSKYEKEEVKGLSEEDVRKYYINKFTEGYLEEPFKEATTVAKYFNHIGVKTFLNWSGSKGLALRIPITNITFEGTELEENPENVKLFLNALAKLIETKILKESYKGSCLDYAVYCKGMQRIPCSKHNKTKLYANFIEPSFNYLEAIDYLEAEVPVYLPEVIDKTENTETLIQSDIYKATIKKAVEETKIKTYDSEIGNIAYKFKSEDHKKLKEMILEIYPESLNFFPYKVIHLLKRTGFSKEEVEAIFHDVEPNPTEYNKNIKGNIKYTFENPQAKICGLKNLVEWIKENYPNHEKDHVIKYFIKNFKYYEVPEETVIEDTLTIKEQEYNLTEVATSKKKYYILKDFTAEGTNLIINKEKAVVYLKQQSKLIAKLTLKTKEGKALEGLVASSKDNLTKFIERITTKTDLTEEIITEAISELDLYFSYMEEQEEEEKELQQQEEEIITEVEENPDFIRFGETEEGFYSQKNLTLSNGKEVKGIYYNTYIKTKEGYDVKTNPVANVLINDVTIILDPLEILEPVYNVTYTNLTFDKKVTVRLTKDQLLEEFIKATVFYYSTKENVASVLNAFIIDGTKEGRITTKTEAYLEGFFIVNKKVVENSKLKNLKKYDPEDVAEAITLLNNIMEGRTEEGKANDSTVYRFMLWNPFSYCLKQIGFKTGIYSLVLIGISKGNKTGAINIGKLFYLVTEEENSGSTVSVLGSKLEENSFSKVFDECYNLLNQPEAPDVMKKATQDKVTRITKNRTDNKKNDKFNAFALPVFLLNERMEFKDYIRERYKITEYTSKSYVTKSERTAFNEKYVPEDKEGTVLRKVAIIGNEFKKKIVPLIEAKDKRLFNPEELTIEILKEIAEETSKATGKEIDFLPEMYTITEASTNYNYDISKEVRTLLNTEFKKKNKVINNEYIPRHFIESVKNNDFDFITYNRYLTEESSEKHFLISYSGLTKFVNNNVEETVEIESILDYLDLTDILKQKMKQENYKKSYEEYIRKQNKIKVEGSKKPKNIKGFYLSIEELINNLFSFNLDFTKDTKTDN